MLGLTAAFSKPPTLVLNQLKPLFLWRSKLPTSDKLVFSEKRGRIPKLMADSITTRVSRGISEDEQGIGALEQEAFIDGSSEFHPNFAAAGLESTLNNLGRLLIPNSEWPYKVPDYNVQTSSVAEHVWSLSNVHRFANMLSRFSFRYGIRGNREQVAYGGAFCMVTLLRHDAKALWIVLGANLNVGLSITLKRILNQERPSTSKSDPGMPSSHAQSIFFIVFIVNLSMMEWLGMNGFTITLAGILLALGSYFTWLRVSQQFHTISQVVVGAVVGSLFSNLWFWLWDAIVVEAFISYLWIRFIVVFGAVGISLVFLYTLFSTGFWVRTEVYVMQVHP